MRALYKYLSLMLFFASIGCTANTSIPSPDDGIAGGESSFVMGDGTDGPNVLQTISYRFYISRFEITNLQFEQFLGDGGYNDESYWTTNGWSEKTYWEWTRTPSTDPAYADYNKPVIVRWYEAVAYCNWRSDKEGLDSAYDKNGKADLSSNGYRMPTEVEWEYMAAKGAEGEPERRYPWGNLWDSGKAVCYNGILTGAVDVGCKTASGGDTPAGLADMCGNVLEWCSDNYQADSSIVSGTDRYYFIADADTGEYQFVLRGGAWHDPGPNGFSCAYRLLKYKPGIAIEVMHDIGFRVVRRLPDQ